MAQIQASRPYWTAYQLLQRLVVEGGTDFDWSSGRLTIDIYQVSISPEERALLDSLDGPTPTWRVDGTCVCGHPVASHGPALGCTICDCVRPPGTPPHERETVDVANYSQEAEVAALKQRIADKDALIDAMHRAGLGLAAARSLPREQPPTDAPSA